MNAQNKSTWLTDKTNGLALELMRVGEYGAGELMKGAARKIAEGDLDEAASLAAEASRQKGLDRGLFSSIVDILIELFCRP